MTEERCFTIQSPLFNTWKLKIGNDMLQLIVEECCSLLEVLDITAYNVDSETMELVDSLDVYILQYLNWSSFDYNLIIDDCRNYMKYVLLQLSPYIKPTVIPYPTTVIIKNPMVMILQDRETDND